MYQHSQFPCSSTSQQKHTVHFRSNQLAFYLFFCLFFLSFGDEFLIGARTRSSRVLCSRRSSCLAPSVPSSHSQPFQHKILHTAELCNAQPTNTTIQFSVPFLVLVLFVKTSTLYISEVHRLVTTKPFHRPLTDVTFPSQEAHNWPKGTRL